MHQRIWNKLPSQQKNVCSKSATGTPEQIVKYVWSQQKRHQNDIKANAFIVNFERNSNLVQMFQLLTLKMCLFAEYSFFFKPK